MFDIIYLSVSKLQLLDLLHGLFLDLQSLSEIARLHCLLVFPLELRDIGFDQVLDRVIDFDVLAQSRLLTVESADSLALRLQLSLQCDDLALILAQFLLNPQLLL